MPHTLNLEDEILNLGTELFQQMKAHSRATSKLRQAEDSIMEWAMSDETLKVDLFRFVDTLPAITSSKEIVSHVSEYFSKSGSEIALLRTAILLARIPGLSPVVSRVAKSQVSRIGKRFIVGQTPEEAIPQLLKLRKNNICFTVDLLGEAAVSEEESAIYHKRYTDLISKLSEINTTWKKEHPLRFEHPADDSIVNVSVKLSSLYSQASAVDFSRSVKILSQRLEQIIDLVASTNGYMYLDMEDCSLTDITLAVIENVLSNPKYKSFRGVGIVLQAYLKRTEADIDRILELQNKRSVPLLVRLVKGAYWDTEVILAKQENWPIPVFEQKHLTDENYERLTKKLLDAGDAIYPAFASHNLRSISHAICYAELTSRSKDQFEIQTLYGMGDEFKQSLIDLEILVRDYAPIGKLLPGMAYLVRRLLENTANEGFLRQANYEDLDPDVLLQNPSNLT